MFDIGFLELLVIGIISLIVLGPERLPKAARTLGLWVGKAKQSFNSIKDEIDRELKVQELQQQIEQQKQQMQEELDVNSIKESFHDMQKDINQISNDLTNSSNSNTQVTLDDSENKSSTEELPPSQPNNKRTPNTNDE